MRFQWLCLAVVVAVPAFAQESEFKGKLKEDMDEYISRVEGACGAKVKIDWAGGKLGHNPRESEKPEWNGISTLCTSGLSAIVDACSNTEVKAKFEKVTAISCTKGKGTMGYTLKGAAVTITVDPSFTKNNASGQQGDLAAKLKKDLDT